MRLLITVALLLGMSSCKSIIINHMIKDPVVETSGSIKAFLVKNDYSLNNQYILRADTSTSLERVFGMGGGFQVFDRNGKLLNYTGSASCPGTGFRELLEQEGEMFIENTIDSIGLKGVLSQVYDLQEQPVELNSLPGTDYYIVSYWQKFMGGKRGYEDGVAWMEKEIKQKKLEKKFTIIKINTDLQDTWGYIPGKKAKLRCKVKGNSMTIEITELPVRR